VTVWMPPEWVGGSESPASPVPEAPAVPSPRAVEPEAPARGPRQPYSWFSPRDPESTGPAPAGSVFSDTVSTTSSRGVYDVAPGRQDEAWESGDAPGRGDAGGGTTDAGGSGGVAAAPVVGESPPPLPRRVPQVPPPPFGVAVSPGGESLFQPPKRRPRDSLPDIDAPESADIPRRPAAGGLIAGWNRPEQSSPQSSAQPFAGEPPAGGAFGAWTPVDAPAPQLRAGEPEPSRFDEPVPPPRVGEPGLQPRGGEFGPQPRAGEPALPRAGDLGSPRFDEPGMEPRAGEPGLEPPAEPAQPEQVGSATRRAAELWNRRSALSAQQRSTTADPTAAGPSAAGPSAAGPAAAGPGPAAAPGLPAAGPRPFAPPGPAAGPGPAHAPGPAAAQKSATAPGPAAEPGPAAGPLGASGPSATPGGPAAAADRPRAVPDAGIPPAGAEQPSRTAEPGQGAAERRGDPWGRPAEVRPDPWERPAAGQARPDEWDRVPRTGAEDRPAAGGWETVLPPVGGTPRVQDRTEDRGAAGVDEATTFMSQWGPPPLAVPRPTEDRGPEPPDHGWGRPAAPSRTGAGRTADNPVDDPPPRTTRPGRQPGADDPARGGWSGAGPQAGMPPVAPQSGGALPPIVGSGGRVPDSGSAAERWIAYRLAADRGTPPAPGTDRAAGGRVDDSFAGWAAEAPVDRAGTEPRRGGGADRTGRPTAGRGGRPGMEDPTEVIGPFDVGAWSVQGRDGTAAPARPRGRQRPPDRPEPVDERPADRSPARAGGGGGGGGGGGAEPPSGGGGGGGGKPDRNRPSLGDRIRTFIRGIGQTFLTLGVVLLLLAAYEVWFTDLVNHRTQKHLTTALEKQWEDGGDDPTVGTKPGQKVRSIPLGDAFALIYIPDFGADYVFSVVEGTGLNELNEGPGHYVDTPLPGAVGNVAIAGHRVGKGSPFLNLDKLQAGSAIVIRTKSYWYTYRVLGDEPTGDADAVSPLGIPGREIVDPSNVGVIAPVPDKPGAKPTRRLLTLTTCHPKFTARQRMVIHAQLEGAPFPVSNGTPTSMTGA
jgi:sortase (surface protein transpeptidase)